MTRRKAFLVFKWNLNGISVLCSFSLVLSPSTDKKSLIPSPLLTAESLQPQGFAPSLSLARSAPCQFPLMRVEMETEFSSVIQEVWLSTHSPSSQHQPSETQMDNDKSNRKQLSFTVQAAGSSLVFG